MLAVSVLLAYLIGSVPFALFFARIWGARDLHVRGSGNLGAANVMRTSGVTPGVIVLLLDVGKGAAGVWLADRLGGAGSATAAAGLAAVVGHIYPVWLRFRGGKGVATACGAFSVLAPVAMMLALGAFIGGVWITRYVSLGSVVAASLLPPLAYATDQGAAVVIAAAAAATLIVFRHRSNLSRVRLGTERRLGARA
jgi:acyl phosphate:glycerol-3-phosphate acyltransferase